MTPDVLMRDHVLLQYSMMRIVLRAEKCKPLLTNPMSSYYIHLYKTTHVLITAYISHDEPIHSSHYIDHMDTNRFSIHIIIITASIMNLNYAEHLM